MANVFQGIRWVLTANVSNAIIRVRHVMLVRPALPVRLLSMLPYLTLTGYVWSTKFPIALVSNIFILLILPHAILVRKITS